MTKVVHCKKERYDVYIGRPSIWGNPYIIGRDGTREQVVQQFREYFRKRDDLHHQLNSLRGLTLGCWCSPHPCHGDVLVEYLTNPVVMV